MDQRSEHEGQPSPALIIDARGAFDPGWHASRTSEELAYLPSSQAAASAALNKLLPVLSGNLLDDSYRRVLFVWDGGFHKTEKKREPKTDEFKADLAYFQQLLPMLLGGAHYTAKDVEADDVVSSAAWKELRAGRRCCVASGDKDLQQLTCKMITYYCFRRKSILSPRYVMDKWDLRHPAQLAVRLAVVGDGVDGIGGVAKWGEKKWADKIMKGFTSTGLPELIEHVSSIIPADQQDAFNKALDVTLLRDDVADIPEPEELVPTRLEMVDEEGLSGQVRSRYAQFIGEWRSHDLEPATGSDVDREY